LVTAIDATSIFIKDIGAGANPLSSVWSWSTVPIVQLVLRIVLPSTELIHVAKGDLAMMIALLQAHLVVLHLPLVIAVAHHPLAVHLIAVVLHQAAHPLPAVHPVVVAVHLLHPVVHLIRMTKIDSLIVVGINPELNREEINPRRMTLMRSLPSLTSPNRRVPLGIWEL